MTQLVGVIEAIEELYAAALAKAAELVERILVPAGPVPRAKIKRLLARSLRNGAWHSLSPGLRAFLRAAAEAPIQVYRSPAVVAVIRRAWLQVELATMRGRALLAALAYILARGGKPTALNEKPLIAIGVQLLNHPLLKLTTKG